MCLLISQKQLQPGCTNKFAPVVHKTPHIAYKAVIERYDALFTPYQYARVCLGEVYKVHIIPRSDRIHEGMHMCLNVARARRHASVVLVALVPPGAEVYYDEYFDEIAVSEAVYFRTKEDAELWWKDNWHKYKNKM